MSRFIWKAHPFPGDFAGISPGRFSVFIEFFLVPVQKQYFAPTGFRKYCVFNYRIKAFKSMFKCPLVRKVICVVIRADILRRVKLAKSIELFNGPTFIIEIRDTLYVFSSSHVSFYAGCWYIVFQLPGGLYDL